jgi:hypothetical protein
MPRKRNTSRVIRKDTRKLTSKPNNRNTKVSSIREFASKQILKNVSVTKEDELYLHNILYIGPAFLQSNGRYVVKDKNISSNRYNNLIKKSKKINTENIKQPRSVLSRQTKAILSSSSEKRNIVDRDKLRNITRGGNKNIQIPRKITKRNLKKRGR